MADIVLSGIAKSFGSAAAVRDVSLSVADREFLALVGPSGCGKSTLLRLIAGLERPDRGSIVIGGEDVTSIPPARRGLSMVFQSYALYPHMSVRDNMAFGLKMAKIPPAEIDQKVRAAAAMLHLEEHIDKKPRQLSGGQRQRAAIGRAIVREPKAFLFDEPLSNLDAALRVRMRLEIVRLQRELATTAVYVTHDQIEAMTMATRIAVMNGGVLEQVGAPMEIYRRPANMFVAGFIGSPRMNFISGKEAEKEGAATIGVRPEHLSLGGPGGRWEGEVEAVEHPGADTFVYVRAGDAGLLTARAGAGDSTAIGERVSLNPVPGEIHRFGPDGAALAEGGA